MAESKTITHIVNLAPGSLAFSLFIAVMMACGLYAAFIAAPAMRAAAQQQLAQTIADENRAFCERFGMRVGSSEFVVCSQELAIVRQRQTERDGEAAQGFL